MRNNHCQPEATLNTAALVRMTHLLVNLSFFQTGYLLPPQVSITIQAPERSVTIFKKALLRWVSGSRITQLPQKQVNLLDAVGKEVRLVCLYNDNIEEVSPLFPHHVCHSFIPAHRKKKNFFLAQQLVVSQKVKLLQPHHFVYTYTKLNGLLVMRKSFFP